MTRATAGRLALLLSAGTVLLAFDLGRRVLASNDETRFPMLARDILANGRWWLPYLNGAPHLNKPPLYAWLTALVAWPTGAVTQGNAPIPSVLAALGVVAITFWVGRRLFSEETGLLAGLAVLTTYGVFFMARVPMPDMALCFVLTAAIAVFVAAELDGRRAARLGFYGLIGAGFWMKGPVALVALAVALAYVLVTHGRAGLARLGLLPGVLVLAVMVLPWWLGGAAAGKGQFTREVVMVDWLGWYVPSARASWRIVTEPIGQALTILLPWSLVLPAALWWAVRARDAERARSLRLVLSWGGAVFVLIALSQQQRMRYYLPVCPPAALLVAAWCADLRLRHRRAVFVSAWIAAAIGLGAWTVYAGARYNAGTDLRALAREIDRSPGALYAVEIPELVLGFYTGQPALSLEDYEGFRALAREGRDGYLVIADRALRTAPADPRVQPVGRGAVNGRSFSIFTSRPAAGSAERQ
jgi:4-amino-4-deoxy-L-arabinose transferase-like glycosyltransferase